MRTISVATLALLIKRPAPHSSAVPPICSSPMPPIAFSHSSPITLSRLLAKATESSVEFMMGPSCNPQILNCEPVLKHWAGGVDAPVPRGSNPRRSNSGPTTFAILSPKRVIRFVPEPPGPPGLRKITPMNQITVVIMIEVESASRLDNLLTFIVLPIGRWQKTQCNLSFGTIWCQVVQWEAKTGTFMCVIACSPFDVIGRFELIGLV